MAASGFATTNRNSISDERRIVTARQSLAAAATSPAIGPTTAIAS
jgi:hypothetical protein